MKITVAFTDREDGDAEELLSAAKTILKAPLKVKTTPPKDGYRHLYISTART